MKNKSLAKSISVVRTTATSLALVLGFAAPTMLSAQLLDLADLPVSLVSEEPPNLILSLDNSRSMYSGSSVDNTDWTLRASRAANFNRIAYDPERSYLPPRRADGSSEDDADFNAVTVGYYFRDSLTVPLQLDLASDFRHMSQVQVDIGFFGQAVTINPTFEPAIAADCAVDPSSCNRAHYYRLLDNATCTFGPPSEDDACYERVDLTTGFSGQNAYGRSFAEEQTNFANWFQYYATRLDAAKTMLTIAFTPDNLADRVRVGRQVTDVAASIQSGSPQAPVLGVTSFKQLGERENFYQWLNSFGFFFTSTSARVRDAMLRAGEFTTQADAYREIPRDGSSPLRSCRRNEHLLVASGDGSTALSYNPASPSLGAINPDDNALTLPDGVGYSPAQSPIFAGPSPLTAADIAFSYWANDAFGGNADNDVPPILKAEQSLGEVRLDDAAYFDPSIDPASWQHLRTSVLGFGVRGLVPVNQPGVYEALLNGSLNWPNPFATQNVVDDLYHAAVNGRGRFGDIFDLDELLSTIASIASVPESTGSISAVATSSGRAVGEDLVYVAEFDTERSIGHLRAFRFSDGSDFRPGQTGGSCNAQIFGTLCDEDGEWDAARENSAGAPQFSDRDIFTINSDSNEGVEFDYANLSTAQQALLDGGDSSQLGEWRLDYVRGDTSREQDNSGAGIFRRRASVDNDSGLGATYLGPVVNSSPVYVGNGESSSGVRTFNFTDSLAGEEGDSYDDFVSNVASKRAPLVLVGANDGMLHAYNASIGVRGGDEEFAYVPGAVYDKLAAYSDPAFQYAAFVDGPISYQDAYVDGEWISMVVGGLRTGGQGYYALDISEVGTDTAPDAEDVVLWEFSDEQDADLGYSFGQAQIVRSNYDGGRWVVLVPSGYNSTESDDHTGSGRAALFVLDAEDGSIIRKLTVGGGSDNAASPNGLSSVAAITVDEDINVETAYAGDIKGRLWKFDLSSSNDDNWRVSLLYNADDDRPITGKPVVGRRPDGGDGVIVYFGTGQLLESADIADNSRQAFYGVLDNNCSSRSVCVRESDLVEQTLSGASDNRVVTSNGVDYNSNEGFIVPLRRTSTGAERIITEPLLIGATVAFTTTYPEASSCGSSTENFLYVLNRATGGEPPNPPLLDNRGETLLAGGDPVVGIQLDNDFPLGGVSLLSTGDGRYSFNTPVANPAADLGRVGRLRWRQLR